MAQEGDDTSGLVARMSVSLPEEQLAALDDMVAARGFASRSQAIGDMLHRALVEHQGEVGKEVMVGMITVFYENAVPGLQKRLADLQSDNIDEVISSLHVHLTGKKTLEAILVQGPPAKLKALADEMTTLRGVISGRMQLVAALIPPLHPLPRKARTTKPIRRRRK